MFTLCVSYIRCKDNVSVPFVSNWRAWSIRKPSSIRANMSAIGLRIFTVVSKRPKAKALGKKRDLLERFEKSGPKGQDPYISLPYLHYGAKGHVGCSVLFPSCTGGWMTRRIMPERNHRRCVDLLLAAKFCSWSCSVSTLHQSPVLSAVMLHLEWNGVQWECVVPHPLYGLVRAHHRLLVFDHL